MRLYTNSLLQKRIGVSTIICVYIGLEYSSPTLASAVGNLTSAFTFILAILFRFFFLNEL
ncbi:hypothetical protein Leryth_022949 [Lithospermum erythrorhizon]|nr:hypothetical protein Leryth_022949 [Lithospermum erythrorhizon]